MSGIKIINKNHDFIGRSYEWGVLSGLDEIGEAAIAVVYGRRRVGKTELLEQVYRKRNLLKFEGVEGLGEQSQREMVMRQLSAYVEDPLLMRLKAASWLDVFDAIHHVTQSGMWTIYFEELQWLSDYRDDFVKYLKLAWDNQFRRNKNNIVVLCGSSPSFMINHVLHSKALYNRSQYEIHLKPFGVSESRAFLPKKSVREVMNAYLTLGGIPEYLKRLKTGSSVFTSICQHSFLPDAYFVNECERIFVSSLKDSPHYRGIIEYLSQRRFSTRDDMSKYLHLGSGGRLTSFLDELVLCGFIKKYVPYNLKDTSTLARYAISDPYLQFYFKFIAPKLQNIASGMYKARPTDALNTQQYQQWLGYAFERYCRDNHAAIALVLGFSGVNYRAGAFYNRSTHKEDPGFQIDLLFDRDDQVVTVCEVKYSQAPVGTQVIEEFERKLQRFETKKTIHKVLVAAEGVDQALEDRHYFDHVITLDDLIEAS